MPSDRNEGRRHLEDAAPEPEPVDEPEGLEVVARMRAAALGSRGFLDARLSGPSDRLENLVRESDAMALLAEKDAEIERLQEHNARIVASGHGHKPEVVA